ncbi:NAD(P)/FAD-dependent oxidoreductase [Piscinibacter terrae]|uniref:FAD-binding oxidoreductase n=1 Tax=Piscinibacter terrae TaxID=2496871 RepID=A0A3N7IR29_9BURK|nr:FAD-dependent oxidoreductase [Albitalea terrae]RQP21342.1 FAD-binding oxidoreductase [Albitalea terrae]
MNQNYDFLVVGGGIAGVAVGSELALHGSVLLIDRESSLSYHTTGRSAAISMESYGNALIRQLTCASRGFFENPPSELTDDALSSPRGALIVGDDAHWGKLNARYQAVVQQVPSAQWLDRKAVAEMAPFLGEQWIAGIHEPSAFDLDVHAIHGAFLRGIRLRGGLVRTEAEIAHARRTGSAWTVKLMNGDTVQAGTIVNASGAWADVVAERCGATRLGIQPLLRTVVVVDPERDVTRCPYIGTVDEQLFIKPDVGRLMVSPCDETPSEPCDALPDELGVAIAMDRLENATTLRPRRVLNRWAGLRIFVPDRSPLIGADPAHESFIWCAALGGYGIQTAPAMARLCAALATHQALPADLRGVHAEDTAPLRVVGRARQGVVAVAELK